MVVAEEAAAVEPPPEPHVEPPHRQPERMEPQRMDVVAERVAEAAVKLPPDRPLLPHTPPKPKTCRASPPTAPPLTAFRPDSRAS